MKKITEGEEFQMATGIFTYTTEGGSIKLKLVRHHKDKPTKQAPSFEEVLDFFKSKGYPEHIARTFYDGYNVNEWKDSNDKPIKNWKMKAIQVWMRQENKEQPKNKMVR
jgi:hypothetical protein